MKIYKIGRGEKLCRKCFNFGTLRKIDSVNLKIKTIDCTCVLDKIRKITVMCRGCIDNRIGHRLNCRRLKVVEIVISADTMMCENCDGNGFYGPRNETITCESCDGHGLVKNKKSTKRNPLPQRNFVVSPTEIFTTEIPYSTNVSAQISENYESNDESETNDEEE